MALLGHLISPNLSVLVCFNLFSSMIILYFSYSPWWWRISNKGLLPLGERVMLWTCSRFFWGGLWGYLFLLRCCRLLFHAVATIVERSVFCSIGGQSFCNRCFAVAFLLVFLLQLGHSATTSVGTFCHLFHSFGVLLLCLRPVRLQLFQDLISGMLVDYRNSKYVCCFVAIYFIRLWSCCRVSFC